MVVVTIPMGADGSISFAERFLEKVDAEQPMATVCLAFVFSRCCWLFGTAVGVFLSPSLLVLTTSLVRPILESVKQRRGVQEIITLSVFVACPVGLFASLPLCLFV